MFQKHKTPVLISDFEGRMADLIVAQFFKLPAFYRFGVFWVEPVGDALGERVVAPTENDKHR